MNGKSWTLTMAGEWMGTRRFSMYNEPEFLSLIQKFRDADIGFAHLEMNLHHQLTPAIKGEWYGGYFGADPGIADDLKWAGFDMMSCAHNHNGDFGELGIMETIRHFDRVGIVHAGTGPDLARAAWGKCVPCVGIGHGFTLIRRKALETIKRYNAAVKTDTPFDPNVKDGRCTVGLPIPKSNWALTIDQPPFEAFAVTCGVTFTFGGLKIDREGRVIDTDGAPIPGLYAAGELVGGLFYFNYPGGTGLMSGMVFGRIAGTGAGKRAAAPPNK